MTYSEARKMPIKEFYLDRVLEGLDLQMPEFIDLCILMGCDYCDSIKGIGPKRAIELIQKHRNIEGILKVLDTKKYPLPEKWPYQEARRLFIEPEITDPGEVELIWGQPDEEGLVKYLAEEKGFAEDRVRNGTKKLQKAKKTSTQGRLDSFFTVTAVKRAAETPGGGTKGKKEEKPAAKKGRGGGGFRRGK